MKKNDKNAVFYTVFVLWEAETTANSDVFEGQVAKNTVIYSVFWPNVQKTVVFARFLATGRHKTLVFTMVLAVLKIAVKLRQRQKYCKHRCFWLEKNPKMSPKTGPKSQKNASGPPHISE